MAQRATVDRPLDAYFVVAAGLLAPLRVPRGLEPAGRAT